MLALINRAAGAVSRNSTIPILSNLLLESVSTDTIRVIGTDMEVEIHATGKVGMVEGTFSVTVDARKLIEVLKVLPSTQTVYLESGKNNSVCVRGKGFRFHLATMPANDLPRIDLAKEEGAVSLTLDTKDFAKALGRVQHAQGINDIRYYLNSTLLSFGGKDMFVAATDGHRMALAKMDSPTVFSEDTNYILQRKAANELLRVLKDSTGLCQVKLSKRIASFQCEGIVFHCKLLDGVYPSFKRVVPTVFSATLSVSAADLHALVARSSILADEKVKFVAIRAKRSNEGAVLSMDASNSLQEEAQADVPVELEGSDQQLGMNVFYIRDLLSSFTGDTLKLKFTDSNSTLLFQDPEDNNFLCIVMPMRM